VTAIHGVWHVAIGYILAQDQSVRVGTAYILVHQAGLANTAIAEDDDLQRSATLTDWLVVRFYPYLQQDLLPRRHVG